MFINPKPFPKCTIKCEKDKGYTSNEKFICVIADDRFEDEITVKILSPYWERYEEKGSMEDFYSWYDKCGNVISHYQQGHGDHDSVIDWFPLDDISATVKIIMDYYSKGREYAESKKEDMFY